MTRRDIIGSIGLLAALAGFAIGAIATLAGTFWLRSHAVLTFAVLDRYHAVMTPLTYVCLAMFVGGILAHMFTRQGPGSMWKAWGMAGIWLTLYAPALLVDRTVWAHPAKFWWVWPASVLFLTAAGAYTWGAIRGRKESA